MKPTKINITEKNDTQIYVVQQQYIDTYTRQRKNNFITENVTEYKRHFNNKKRHRDVCRSVQGKTQKSHHATFILRSQVAYIYIYKCKMKVIQLSSNSISCLPIILLCIQKIQSIQVTFGPHNIYCCILKMKYIYIDIFCP